MLYEFSLSTDQQGMYNVTTKVREALAQSGVKEGLCVVFCPHTTAGITINENADPDVQSDILLGLSSCYREQGGFRHAEGNSTAHLKALGTGASETVIVEKGALVLGRWQGIYFCEFDGPRTRKFIVKVIAD